MGWLAALDADDFGCWFVRNLTADCRIESSTAGQQALDSLLRYIAALVDFEGVLETLRQELSRGAQIYLCQGDSVPSDTDTDSLSHVRSLESTLRRLIDPNVLTDQNIIPAATGIADDRNRRLQFARTFLEDESLRRMVILEDAEVRGGLPLVFATPALDRHGRMGPVTSTRRICQLIGIPEITDDLTVLDFAQSRVGEGHVPTAIDAFVHEHFWAPNLEASWGRTRDLSDGVTEGVRECVVREFSASLIDHVEIVAQS
jgi:hypothetical protein